MAIPYVMRSPYVVRAGARFTSDPGGLSLSVTRNTRLLPFSLVPLHRQLVRCRLKLIIYRVT